jgi:hypothetical protein
VTFITATSFLNQLNLKYGGHLVAAMALLESPAIVIGIGLSRVFNRGKLEKFSWPHLIRDAFLTVPSFY